MMIFKLYLILLVSASLHFLPQTEAVDYSGQQVWRIVPHSEEILHKVKEIGDILKLDFWREPSGIGMPIDVMVDSKSEKEMSSYLRRNGVKDYKIYIQDVQKLIQNQRRSEGRAIQARSVADFDYTAYHTAEEIYNWMDMVVQEYGSIVTKKQIGVSYEGRPIYALEFSKTPSPGPKPKIFVDSLIHSREWISTASLIYIFKEMLQNPAFSHMLDDVDWYFVPMINVDGYVKTWTEDRLWRKTAHYGASSACIGVDGNRNWDTHWSEPGASPNPCSLAYYGPTAASESEVRNLANYVLGFGFGNIDAYITVHSYSQLILFPYGYAPVLTPDNDYLNSTGQTMSDAIKAVHGKEYVNALSASGIYVTSGATDDWAYDKAGARLTYTYELRDTGKYGFVLPSDQIIPQGEEFIKGLEALKNVVVENF